MKRRRVMAIMNLVAFLGMVMVNVLAGVLPINGTTTEAVSALYPNLFVPSGITFLIWAAIYVLLAIFVIYQIVTSWNASKIEPTVVEHVGPWFLFTCLANSGWIFAWHYSELQISLIVIGLLLVFLIVLYLKLDIGSCYPSKGEVFLVEMPFSIYLGWVSVALIANASTYLVSIGWDRFGIDAQWWTIGMIGIATVLGLFVIKSRKDVFFGIVIDWALLGIFLARNEDIPKMQPLLYTLMGCILIITVCIIYRIIKRDVYYI